MVKTSEAPTAVPESSNTVPKQLRQLGNHAWAQEVVRDQGPMVILNNLPHHITYTQVMEGVTGLGGINSVAVMAEPAPSRKGAFCAMINFNDTKAVDAYIDFFKKKPLFFVDKDGDIHKASMLSFKGETPSIKESHHPTSGRCLEFANFRASDIWTALLKIGILGIVRVNFNPDTSGDLGELSIELTTAMHASRVRTLALDGHIPGFSGIAENISDGLCESDYHPSHIQQRFNNVIPYTGPDHLEKKWNQKPYNGLESLSLGFPSMQHRTHTHARYPDFPLPQIPEDERLHSATPSTHEDRARHLLIPRGGFLYGSDGGNVHKRDMAHPETTSPVRGDDLRTLVESTLADPEWFPFWRDVVRQQEHLSFEAYGRMVEHRRLNTNGQISCPDDCNECHPNLRDSLTPPLRTRMYTQMGDDGYIYAEWLRSEDEQTRRSVRGLSPQMGQIIRSD
ncbi:hypothetical protein BHE90_012960 [Fusarium euwallaceae]|uniref:RRM domain-containing protein n=3 Tax=Fusarium solani species complex TaxID=232080 RepID=A0A3M2S2E7_9HYPO|nr:hypothetical protein CDV36_008659 [Fusarium kuroshium]RSM05312.1 hypothetical protein CEP52_006319 [Fusarium oligoseptatum]RTE72608.1 hypothetical protein BHE90_012960 [Fusarium euwallaceae]